MVYSLNKVILLGNLDRTSEKRFTQDSKQVVTFPLATSTVWKDKVTKEHSGKVEWHHIVIFNERLGEIAEKFFHKGSKVYLEGQLQTRSWQNNKGQERFITEIVLHPFRGELIILDSRNNSEDIPMLREPLEEPTDVSNTPNSPHFNQGTADEFKS